MPEIPNSLKKVRRIVLVLSGKGGVGKSSVTAQLALTLAQQKRGQKCRIGVLDIDLTGPSAPRMFGLDNPLTEKKIHQSSAGWIPVYLDETQSIGIMSIGFLLENRGDAVVWRGPKKTAMIRQFLTDVVWGELDYLLIDTPPGTSDEHIAVIETLLSFDLPAEGGRSSMIDGAVLVTTPQQVSTLDVKKELNFCRKVNVPILGIVENMSGFICPHCADCTNIFSTGGGEDIASQYGIDFLGRVPIDPKFTELIEKQHNQANQEAQDIISDDRDSSVVVPKATTSSLVERYHELELSKVFALITRKVRHRLQDGEIGLKCIVSLSGHDDRVWHVAQHPDLPLLATASSDKTVRIWNTRTWAMVALLESQHSRSVRYVAWKPGERLILATASFDGTVGIWERGEGIESDTEEAWECTATLEGHENEVKCVAWAASGTLLATCSRDKSVWVWEVEDEEEYDCLGVLQEHTQDVKGIAWHPNEELLASASYDDTIRMWRDDGDDWTSVAVLEGHESTVWSIDFERTERNPRLVSASDDGTLRIWVRQGRDKPHDREALPSVIRPEVKEEWVQQSVLRASTPEESRALYSVSWSKRSGRIATCGSDGHVVVFVHDESSGEWKILCQLANAHGEFEVNCVSWGVQGDQEVLFSGGDDSEAKAFSIQSLL